MDPGESRLLIRDGAKVGMDQTADLGPYLLRVIWVLGGLSTALLGSRLFSKIWRRRTLWWDDYVLMAAWVSSIFRPFQV